jgi:hypothetical protein
MRFLLSILATALTGCAVTGPVYVYVDSVAGPEASELRAYHLVSGRRGLTNKDPIYRELAGYAHNALQQAGFSRAETVDAAEVIVALTYGMNRERDGNLIQSSSFVKLTGFDWVAVKTTGARNAIWTTQAYRYGPTGGLDQTAPKLLRLAAPHIATTTGDIVEIQIN